MSLLDRPHFSEDTFRKQKMDALYPPVTQDNSPYISSPTLLIRVEQERLAREEQEQVTREEQERLVFRVNVALDI